MSQNLQNNNNTVVSRHCEGGTTEAIQKKKPLAWIASFFAMTFCLLLSSCEKEIEFKGEQTDPKLVINSLMEPGQPVKANISKSYFFLDDPATTAPNDLVATLYVNGNPIGEMMRQMDTVFLGGYTYDDLGNMIPYYKLTTSFVNDYRPHSSDIIKITASANGFDDVEAETSPLPNALFCAVIDSKIKDWTSGYSPWYNEFENEEDSVFYIYCNLELTIEITDPNPGQTDFFRIHANRGSQYDDGVNYISYYAEYNDPIFSSAIVGNNEYVDFSELDLRPEGVFTDVLFDGKSYQLKMPFNISIRKNEDANLDFFRIGITLEHLSKEYYNYLNTCDQGDVSMQLYAEPIQTYSNVKGGYGIVAGHTVDTLWFAVPLEE